MIELCKMWRTRWNDIMARLFWIFFLKSIIFFLKKITFSILKCLFKIFRKIILSKKSILTLKWKAIRISFS